MPSSSDIRDLSRSFLDLVFPRNCVITGEAVESTSPFEFISLEASSKIFRVESPYCRTCGYPYFGAVMANDRACPKCKELNPVYDEGRTVILVEGIGRELVHQFKYENATYLRKDFKILFEASPGLAEYVSGASLVPVPLHPRKLRERGFNQSGFLCQALMSLEPSATLADVLSRIVDTPSQTLFSRTDRLRNLRHAFEVKPNCEVHAERRYIVVDDVFTTGSTLNACAKVLKKGGAQRIDILTLGHG